MKTMSRTHGVRLTLAASLLLAAPMMAACGDKESEAALPSAPGQAADEAAAADGADSGEKSREEIDAAWAKFDDCMAENGLFSAGEEGTDAQGEAPSLADAQAACEPILDEAGVLQQAKAGIPEEMKQQLLDATECMREKGYDLPDPDFGPGGGTFTQVAPNGDEAALEEQYAAQAECNEQVGLDAQTGLPQ